MCLIVSIFYRVKLKNTTVYRKFSTTAPRVSKAAGRQPVKRQTAGIRRGAAKNTGKGDVLFPSSTGE